MGLPSGQDLLTLERESRKIGSNVNQAALIGDWKLKEIWAKKNSEPSGINGEILRGLKATLQIKETAQEELEIINSVKLVGFKLCFWGPGWLIQKRPLLSFYFQQLTIEWAGKILLAIPLSQPQKIKPFFALIGSAQTETGMTWLAARGRGGGLALWVREDAIAD